MERRIGSWSVESRSELSIVCNWRLSDFYKSKPRVLSSPPFKVGDLDCAVRIHPRGNDSEVERKGYASLTFAFQNDCLLDEDTFFRFGVKVFNVENGSMVETELDDWGGRMDALETESSVSEFLLRSRIRDCKTLNFRVSVQILDESFEIEEDTIGANPGISTFHINWNVREFSSLIDFLSKEQHIISPCFMMGDLDFSICVCQGEHQNALVLSLILQSERPQDPTGKNALIVGQLTVHNNGQDKIVNEICNRFVDDFRGKERTDCSTSYAYPVMKMDELPFFLLDDTAYFQCLLHLVSDVSSLTDTKGGYCGKFQWTISNFGELLKQLKTNEINTSKMYFTSRSFSIGKYDYCVFLNSKGDKFSVLLDVSKTVYAFYKVSLLNQSKEVVYTKQVVGRHSEEKRIGWDHFVPTSKLLDEKWRLLADNAIAMSLEVLVLKEDLSIVDGSTASTWRWTVDNWNSFKEILGGGNSISSDFFTVFGSRFRIVFSHSCDTHDVYLERKGWSDKLVMYRITLEKDCQVSSMLMTEKKGSVLSFRKVSNTSLVFVCEILKVLDLTNFTDKIEPELQLPVIHDLTQMDCSSEVCKSIVDQSHVILKDAFDGDGVLAATIVLILKAASKCELVKEVVGFVRTRLTNLNSDVSRAVLESLSKAVVRSHPSVSDAMLESIDYEDEGNEICFCDIYILVEMLSAGRLVVKAGQTFERALSLKRISAHVVDSVLERRQAMRVETVANVEIDQLRGVQGDLTVILDIAEKLELSKNPQVKDLVKSLYTILFKRDADGYIREKVANKLVLGATRNIDNNQEGDLEFIGHLISEHTEILGSVLKMIRKEVSEPTKDDCKDEMAILSCKLVKSEEQVEELQATQRSKEDEIALLSDTLAKSAKQVVELQAVQRCKEDEMVLLSNKLVKFEKQVAELEAAQRCKEDEMTLLSDKLAESKRVLKEKSALAERLLNGVREKVETTAAAMHDKVDEAVAEIKEDIRRIEEEIA